MNSGLLAAPMGQAGPAGLVEVEPDQARLRLCGGRYGVKLGVVCTVSLQHSLNSVGRCNSQKDPIGAEPACFFASSVSWCGWRGSNPLLG